MTSYRIHDHRTCHIRPASRLAGILLVTTLVVIFAAGPVAAQTFTILHNFTGGADGDSPTGGLIFKGTGNLYGAAGDAAVFRFHYQGASWVLNPIFEFNGTNGAFPYGRLTVGPDGALFGVSYYGGIPECHDEAGCGLVFRLQPPQTFCANPFCFWTETILYQFNPLNAPRDGYGPNGGIVFDSAGNLYGTTDMGGEGDQGTVYEITRSGGGWVENSIFQFDSGPDGGIPNAGMVIDQAGNLYGTTYQGGDPTCLFGDLACGVVFELSPTSSGWVETVLHTFQNGSDGADPLGGLIADSNGNLYGTTSIGGANGGGTVFKLTRSGSNFTFSVLYSLTGNPRSQIGPEGLLALDSSGNLYGITNSEGPQSAGNLFELTPSGGIWIYTDLHDFAISPSNGAYPHDGPTLDGNGNLFGTSLEGGTGNCPYGCGVIWELTP